MYQGNYISYPGVLIHEMGHNLNLAHSGSVLSRPGSIGPEHTKVRILRPSSKNKKDIGAEIFLGFVKTIMTSDLVGTVV